jgi:arylsulfatase A-like enzyme
MSRPNVLVIMQDQLRYDLVASDMCATPNLDRLRAEGRSFSRAYTPTALCGPARASLLTGRYPHGHGLLNNVSAADAVSRNLPRNVPTVAELLGSAGYRTGFVGKWHVGVEDQADSRGFTDVRLDDTQTWAFAPDPADRTGNEYVRWAQSFPLDGPQAVHTCPPAPHPQLAERNPRRPVPLYSHEVVPDDVLPAKGVLDHTAELLSEYAGGGEPFFLVASFLEPHWPYILPLKYATMYNPADLPPWPNFNDDYIGKPGANAALREHFGVTEFTWDDWAPVVAHYLGMVTFVDELVGRLLDRVDELDLAGNTVVLATTDHGDMAGSHGLFNKGPVMYEEAYRIPFVWRGPGVTAGESDALTGLVDVCPTILDLAGLAAPGGVHGHCLADVLRGDESGWRDAIMSEFHGDEFGLYSQRMIRKDQYKLIYNAHDVRELYDLDADPAELHNLANDPSYHQLRLDLEADLYELMADSADPLCGHASNVLG